MSTFANNFILPVERLFIDSSSRDKCYDRITPAMVPCRRIRLFSRFLPTFIYFIFIEISKKRFEYILFYKYWLSPTNSFNFYFIFIWFCNKYLSIALNSINFVFALQLEWSWAVAISFLSPPFMLCIHWTLIETKIDRKIVQLRSTLLRQIYSIFIGFHERYYSRVALITVKILQTRLNDNGRAQAYKILVLYELINIPAGWSEE